jgi:hypothetical protein
MILTPYLSGRLSNGMRNSPEYVFQFLEFLSTQPVKRVLLPRYFGVLIPSHTPLSLFRKLLQNIQTFILISMRTMIMI